MSLGIGDTIISWLQPPEQRNAERELAKREDLRLEEEYKSELQKDREFEAEQLRLAREYDLPINQKQRYIDAGLNPYYQQISAGEFGQIQARNLAEKKTRTELTGTERTAGTMEELSGLVSLVTNTVSAVGQLQDYNINRAMMKNELAMSNNDKLMSDFNKDNQKLDKQISTAGDVMNYILQLSRVLLGSGGIGRMSRPGKSK